MTDNTATVTINEGDGYCSGRWTLDGIEPLEQRLDALCWPSMGELSIDGSQIASLDTFGALSLIDLVASLQQAGRKARLTGLRSEQQALIDLVTERTADDQPLVAERAPGGLARLGRAAWLHGGQAQGFLAFIGETSVALARTAMQPRRLRGRALLVNLQAAGVDALPIIALLAFLMGVVIAYQGGVQLKTYGANIFIVELVSLTMLREIAPLITAIIVAGRTGSAYAAQIGTMKVTEEIDALRTIGIAPIELLVLPKLLALLIALPLLTIFADGMSLLGGMVMAVVLLGVSFSEFVDRIPQVVTVTSLMIGLGKAPLFAAVIALVGCYQGFQVTGGADSVGRQTTVSVVQAIFLVIIVDAVVAVFLGGLGL